MATYCWKCLGCGARWSDDFAGQHCSAPQVKRDYAAEGVGYSGLTQLKKEREFGGRTNYRNQFLPTAADYAGPSDPDGSKGITQWAEEHHPADSNKSPLRPDIPKRSF